MSYTKATGVILSLVLILLSACSRVGESHWSSINTQFDSINNRLDSLYIEGKIVMGETLINRIDSMAAIYKNDDAKSRVLYWKSVAYGASMTDSTEKWIKQAFILTDSIRHPYQHARLCLIDNNFNTSNYLQKYAALRNAFGYFTRIGDKKMQIFSARAISSFFLSIKDYNNFYIWSKKTDELCRENNFDSLAERNRINFALWSIRTGDSIQATQIISEMLHSKHIRSDSAFVGRLYVNLAILRHNPIYFQKAIEISPIFAKSISYRTTLQFAMVRMYEQMGMRHQSDSILANIEPIIIQHGDPEAKAMLQDIYTKRYEDNKDYGNAYLSRIVADRYRDSAFSSIEKASVADYARADEIARIESENERENFISMLIWGSCLVVVALSLIIVLLMFQNRHKRLRLKQLDDEMKISELSLSLEREKRRLVAMGLAMNESDNIVKELISIADELNKSGSISEETKAILTRKAKEFSLNQKEIDDFKSTYEKVHPQFLSILKAKYPNLTEGDVKLSIYISVGLSTKQIAQLLHLQPDSVQKNRKRLRSRMGLPTEVSLEEALREII